MTGVDTLRGGATISTTGRIGSIGFNWVANVSSALRTESPACKLGVVVDGG